jgi:hypothetical protein
MSWDGETEIVDVELDVDAAAGPLGFVFASPSPADVTIGDSAVFASVDAQTAPAPIPVDDWWGRSQPAQAESESGSASSRVPFTVEPEIVQAQNSKALSAWLDETGFALTDAAADVIASYANDGWSLALVSLDGSGGQPIGPVTFSFPTTEPVFPLRLAAVNESEVDYRFYVLDDHRSEFREAPQAERHIDAGQSVVWAGAVSHEDLAQRGSYLTVIDVRFEQPHAQIRSDIAIVDAPSDDQIVPTVESYRPVELLGMPLGWLIVVWAGFGLLLGVGYLVNRFRSR